MWSTKLAIKEMERKELKRARKEIEINSPKKKKVELMHIREKQKRCFNMLNHSHLLRPGSDAELFMSRT